MGSGFYLTKTCFKMVVLIFKVRITTEPFRVNCQYIYKSFYVFFINSLSKNEIIYVGIMHIYTEDSNFNFI